MRGGAAPPRSGNARTRLLTMVFDAAQLYHVEGRVEEAIRVCNHVMKADPTNAEAIVLLGDIYAEQNRKDVALAMYERAVRIQPNNLLYRQKWDKLRHGESPAEPTPTSRAGTENPWARTKRKSLSERLSDMPSREDSNGSGVDSKAVPSAAQTANTPIAEARSGADSDAVINAPGENNIASSPQNSAATGESTEESAADKARLIDRLKMRWKR